MIAVELVDSTPLVLAGRTVPPSIDDADTLVRRGIGVGLDDELCTNCVSLTTPNADELLDAALQQ